MNLQEQILEELSGQMHSAIDFEILADVLCRFGWHKVDLERFQNNKQAVDITTWLENNCKSSYHREGRYFLFENAGDAVNFTLRWRC